MSGEAIFRWKTSAREFPLLAGGFNHRAEALYRCVRDHGENHLLQDALKRGLRKVKILHWSTPLHVFSRVVSLLNQFHNGAGSNHYDLLNEAGAVARRQNVCREPAHTPIHRKSRKSVAICPQACVCVSCGTQSGWVV